MVITKELGKFYATACREVPDELMPVNENGKTLGIDVNAGQYATSEGEIRRLPDLKRLESRKKRYQRMMARRRRPNHQKAELRISPDL